MLYKCFAANAVRATSGGFDDCLPLCIRTHLGPVQRWADSTEMGFAIHVSLWIFYPV